MCSQIVVGKEGLLSWSNASVRSVDASSERSILVILSDEIHTAWKPPRALIIAKAPAR
jgi:hypothetical protein